MQVSSQICVIFEQADYQAKVKCFLKIGTSQLLRLQSQYCASCHLWNGVLQLSFRHGPQMFQIWLWHESALDPACRIPWRILVGVLSSVCQCAGIDEHQVRADPVFAATPHTSHTFEYAALDLYDVYYSFRQQLAHLSKDNVSCFLHKQLPLFDFSCFHQKQLQRLCKSYIPCIWQWISAISHSKVGMPSGWCCLLEDLFCGV